MSFELINKTTNKPLYPYGKSLIGTPVFI
ncbi:MAG: hypothetical protein KF687_12460 [Cyclobacteriaceae bacterium]|nr:hypothetical protein [Cyclobacteriaceae bacterium]